MKKAAVLLLVFILVGSFFTLFSECASSLGAVENSWSAKTAIPQAGSRVAVVDGKIHAISGAVHYIYDPITDDWTSRKSMPTPRHYFGIAVCDNKIYTIGGGYWDDGWVTSNVNEVYDPQTDSWETKTSMPTSRMSLYANEVDGKIYLIGGQTGGPNSIVDLNEVYDVATDSWTGMEKSPYAVCAYGSAVVDGKIYLIGGSASHSAYVSLNQIYDPAADSWSFGAEMPEAVRDGAAGATSGLLAPKRIYVIGGGPDMLAYNFTQVYNPENDSWTLGAEMPTSRGWLAVAVVNDLIYAIGGSPYLMASSLTTNEQYVPYGYGTSGQSNDEATLAITLISPENKTYYGSSIPLEFSSKEPLSWMGYRLDNGGIIEVAGNTTITDQSLGSHNLTLYATDKAGNTVVSQTIYFTIQEGFQPLQTALPYIIIACVLVALFAGVFYFRKKARGVMELEDEEKLS
jgi:N-acetylneuraminic acid mutarotase